MKGVAGLRIGKLVSKLFGASRARSLHLWAVSVGVYPKTSTVPQIKGPSVENTWVKHAIRIASLGRASEALWTLIWAIEMGKIGRKDKEQALENLFHFSLLSEQNEISVFSAQLLGTTPENLVQNTKNLKLLADIRDDGFSREASLNIASQLLDDPNELEILIAAHNRSLSSSGLWPLGADDPFWVLNKQRIKASSFLLRKIEQSDSPEISNVEFEVDHDSNVLTQHKITVIMPAYNAGDTITYAIRAVLNQTHQNFELLVIDDASTDDTANIAAKFSQHDSRVKLIRCEKNGGSYTARNLGLLNAEGEFVLVVDADDMIFPEMLEVHAHSLAKNDKLIAVVSKSIKINTGLQIQSISRLNTSSLTFRRNEVISSIGFWDESVRVGADSEFFERITANFGSSRVLWIQRNLSFIVVAEKSLTSAGEFSIGVSLKRPLGYRAVYKDFYRNWHSSGQKLYCERGQGLRFMIDFPTSVSRPILKPNSAKLILRLSDEQELERIIAPYENKKVKIFVADQGCLFDQRLAPSTMLKKLIEEGKIVPASYEYLKAHDDVSYGACRGREIGDEALAEICGCENKVV